MAQDQIRISPRPEVDFASDGYEYVRYSESGDRLSVSCGGTAANFSKKHGAVTSLVMNGVNVFSTQLPSMPGGPRLTYSRALVDNDKWLMWPFIHSGLKITKYHPEPIEIVSNGVKVVNRITGLKSAMFIHEAVYEFSKDGSVIVRNTVKPRGCMPPQLPRLGLSMRLDPSLEKMRYFGRGPWENYIDRNSGAFFGIWNSTVTEQYEPYVRPQDNGYKSDVRWVQFLDEKNRGIKFESDVPLFMQALHVEEDDLHQARHINGEPKKYRKLEFQDDIFLKLDARQCGLGGSSCGPQPLKKYLFNPNENVVWTLRISPVK